MSSPQDFHLNFKFQDISFDIDLAQGKKSDHSVKINGINYAVLGDEEKLQRACEILNTISLDSISSFPCEAPQLVVVILPQKTL
jgi:hypothetical protein